MKLLLKILVLVTGFASGCQGAQIIVANKDVAGIAIASDAPTSVRVAGSELRFHLAKAIGRDVPISASGRIGIVDTPAARAAGIDASLIPLEGYRIVARRNVVYRRGRYPRREAHD